MLPIDAVLKLRPTNVVNRLERSSRACVLNGRDLQRAVGDAAVVVFELAAPRPVATALFSAARQAGAAIGLSAPSLPQGEGLRPDAFFSHAIALADEAMFELPMLLRGGPVVVTDVGERAVSLAREQVFRFVDAGFTSVCVDPGALPAAARGRVVAELSGPLRERELELEVFSRDGSETALRELVSGLSASGCAPDVVSIAASARQNFTALRRAVGPATLAVVDPAAASLARAGVKRVNVASTLEGIIFGSLPAELADKLRAWMANAGADRRAALARFWSELRQLDEAALVKMEALAYHEAVDLIAAAGGPGGATAAVALLSEKSGY